MSANTWQVWSSAAVILLSAAAALVVLPYAIREVYIDRRRLRGQFALGLGVLFVGISGRLTAALLFYFTAADHRAEVLHVLHPWILLTNGLIALGALQCIRLVTIRKNGEGVWLAVLAGSAILALVVAVGAQTNHAQHHAHYQNWINKADKGCCNNQDCGELAEQNERSTASGGVEVQIDGTWCPVQPFHYLKKGNAPNWSTAHVCVQKQGAASACDRLLCYQPRPGI